MWERCPPAPPWGSTEPAWAQVISRTAGSSWEIDVRQGTRATIQPIGEVLVDCARLGFVDVEMLAEWEHDEAIDGRADFLLWGLDAAEIAEIQDIPSVGEEQFGWVNLPVEEVVERGLAIEALREAGGHRFATDFRPHSHHYRLMEEIRSSPTESGTFALGDAKLCAFMTTWGDGVFPVEVDRDAEGNVLTIRVVLRAAAGSPKIQ